MLANSDDLVGPWGEAHWAMTTWQLLFLAIYNFNNSETTCGIGAIKKNPKFKNIQKKFKKLRLFKIGAILFFMKKVNKNYMRNW